MEKRTIMSFGNSQVSNNIHSVTWRRILEKSIAWPWKDLTLKFPEQNLPICFQIFITTSVYDWIWLNELLCYNISTNGTFLNNFQECINNLSTNKLKTLTKKVNCILEKKLLVGLIIHQSFAHILYVQLKNKFPNNMIVLTLGV